MKTVHVVLLCGLLAPAVAAEAQEAMRVRGAISSADGSSITVKSSGGKEVAVRIAEKTVIVYTQPIALSEIKPGDFLALTSVKRDDGTLTAYDVRRFPRPSNPGHRRFDGKSDQTMTNATVGAMAQAANGRELTMTYDGGSQKILVPQSASVSTLVPGNRSHLLPGAPVNLTAAAGDGGMLTAIRIQVGPPR